MKAIAIVTMAAVLAGNVAAGEPDVDVIATGVVKDYDGKTVTDAFVMFKGNASLCVMTNSEGEFRIAGRTYELPETLLVSLAGCETARVRIDRAQVEGLAVALKAQDAKSAKTETAGAHRLARAAVVNEWDRRFDELKVIISNGGNLYKPSSREDMSRILVEDPGLAARGIGNDDKSHALDLEAFYHPSDKDPFDIVFRRTKALLECLHTMPEWKGPYAGYQAKLDSIRRQSSTVADPDGRKQLYGQVCMIRRELAFSNPVLDFNRILCASRSDIRNNVLCSFAPGRGVWIIHDPFGKSPRIENIFQGKTVHKGRYKGKPVSKGMIASLELSFDGNRILFGWCPNIPSYMNRWDPDKKWHLFEANVDGSNCVQLTDGPFCDMDPCYLPSGRIAFTSYRRSPEKIELHLRCGSSAPAVYTLHSCAADGSDIVTMSYHDLPESNPSVDHDGRLVYTRWEYYDKASHWTANLWKMYPDGRDPRAPHGNYYYPHQTFDRTALNGRGSGFGNPMTEMNIRAVPGHPGLYTATVGAVHFGELGSLILINTTIPDDFGMGQACRLTPEIIFPESEDGNMHPKHGTGIYGYCWPLGRDFYLCSYAGNICYLDRFGNRELICAADELPGAKDGLPIGVGGPDGHNHQSIGLVDPIPLRPRPMPLELPVETYEGERHSLPHKPATIRIMNVYDSLFDWPPEVLQKKKIKSLRVLQVFPKNNEEEFAGLRGTPALVDYDGENGCRMPLGVVPVESDGSVHLYAPIQKDIFFQVLDENGMAIQSMRSATYVQAGEHLTCSGCHEDKWKTPQVGKVPIAFKRAPSVLKTEVSEGAVPFNYHQLVKPVFENTCIPCHVKQDSPKALKEMNYYDLREYAFFVNANRSIGGFEGGSHTIPGHFGALASRMGKAMLNPTHQRAKKAGMITEDDFRRVVLWLDCNSSQFGSIYSHEHVLAQRRGETVFPKVDFKVWNPLGLEVSHADNTPPSAVTGLRATPTTASPLGIELAWKPATDPESGVGCYAIYRNGSFLAWALRPSYSDKDMVQGGRFTYEVLAINRKGDEGPKSSSVTGVCHFDPDSPHIIKWDHAGSRMSISASGVLRRDFYEPLNTVNGSGLSGSVPVSDLDDLPRCDAHERGLIGSINRSALSGEKESHDTDKKNMWISGVGRAADKWIQYDFGKVCQLTKMHIWNCNAGTNRGIKKADVLISTDGEQWTPYAESVLFPQADGTATYEGFSYSFGNGISTRHVKINVKSNYGGESVGLGEVQFYYGLEQKHGHNR